MISRVWFQTKLYSTQFNYQKKLYSSMHKSPYTFAPDAHIIILFLVKMNNERRMQRIQTVHNLLWPDES